MHISLAFSDRERTERDSRVMDPITNIKESMHSIFVQSIGLQGPVKIGLFSLHRTSDRRNDTLIFITGMRLDLAGHTVVADAFVLPSHGNLLDRLAKSMPPLPLCEVNVKDEVCIAWKVLLPSLVERCRTWEHAPNCAYTVQGKVPLSTKTGESPICECGKGKVTDAFRRRKEWAPFLPYVTRVALSSLFAVSYLESVAGGLGAVVGAARSRVPDPGPGPSRSIENSVRCSTCNNSLSASKAMVCSKCKTAVYCSRECQAKDWKTHKPLCKKD